MRHITVGISTKMYLGYEDSKQWLAQIVTEAMASPEVRNGAVRVFVAPAFTLLEYAIGLCKDTPVSVGAQNCSEYDSGPFTGEVSPLHLSEMGVGLVEIGHAERRDLFGESEEVVAAKVAAVQRNGLVPLLCVGEVSRMDPEGAARACLEQIRSAQLPPDAIIAYEPVWAIGADQPAGGDHVKEVVSLLKEQLPPAAALTVIYGGSAGPGLLPSLRPAVDGLFLGRFAHDPKNFAAVLAECKGVLASQLR